MERLVFSNAEIAATMNKWFINIKVDREERPDLDRIYMTATNLINRRGGWPNSLFLTPDLEPFFAGTYFPPEDAHGRPGFPTILAAMHDYWVDRRPEVVEVAERMTAAIRQLEAAQQEPPTDPDTVLVHRAAAAIKGRYDAANGGFGGAPKFPPSMRLAFLLDAFEQEGDQRQDIPTGASRCGRAPRQRGHFVESIDDGAHGVGLSRSLLIFCERRLAASY